MDAVVFGGRFGDSVLHYSKDVIIHGGKFEEGALWYAEGARVFGGSFGGCALRGSSSAEVSGGEFEFHALEYSKGAVISGGRFGANALWDSRRAIVRDGEFEDYALHDSKGAVILGGFFSKGSFRYAQGIKAYLPENAGSIRQIANPKGGVIVANDLTEVIFDAEDVNPRKTKIFTPGVWRGKDYITKIDPEDIRADVTPENIDEAINVLVKKYC